MNPSQAVGVSSVVGSVVVGTEVAGGMVVNKSVHFQRRLSKAIL